MKRDFQSVCTLECVDFGKDFTPTCLSNGVIGISPGANPLVPVMNHAGTAATVVAGFVQNCPSGQFEQLAPAPYPLGMDIRANGFSIREHPDRLTVHRQALDMQSGELATEMTFAAGDVSLEIEVLQFASRSVPCVVCQKVGIKPSLGVEIELNTIMDTAGTQLTEYTKRTRALTTAGPEHVPDIVDYVRCFETDRRSRLGIALILPRGTGARKLDVGRYVMEGRAGQAQYVRILAALVSDIYHPEPHLEAIRLVRWAEMLGFDDLRDQNREAWAELWKSRIKVTGCSRDDQRALDVAFYYLQSSIHSSSRTGCPPFGLTQSLNYSGHNFWDMDIWMMLPIVLVQPDAARSMVEYRFRGLEAARKKAALFGCRGAQYPWEAAVHGEEATPSSASTGWAEQHITPDVAIGAWEYQLATGDPLFMRDRVWPILQGVAEWIESRGVSTERGFEFNFMMGPDEQINNVSNPAYFNLSAKLAMDAALNCARQLGIRPPRSWELVAKSMYLPMNQHKKVVLPYDPGSATQACEESGGTFADALSVMSEKGYSLGNLHFLLVHGCPVSDEVFRNTYFHEEPVRLGRKPDPGVPGSTGAPGFTSPPCAAASAFCGERGKAAELFVNSWKPYWLAPYGMTREYQSQACGSYITTFGSLLQATMLGLTGLRPSTGNWCKYPAALPEGWTGIEIDRIMIGGNWKRLVAEHGKVARLTDI